MMIGAFFDFDGTLYTGHVWQDLVHHHWATRRHRRWVAAYLIRVMAPLPLYRLGSISQEAFFWTWGEKMGWLLRDWTVQDGRILFEHLTDRQILPNLRSDVLDHLRQHQAQGHLVALVSGTFAPWLETIAQRLGIPHSIGTPLEVRDGRYTGRIVPPLCQGPGKPRRVQGYLAEQRLAIDWAGSFAYADRSTDLPLFDQVGNPVAVYPDEVLMAQAKARGWEVLGQVSA